MKIKFELITTFPRLAWCAKIQKDEDMVTVRHGPWVETRDECFFEGAWDGSLDELRFDEAVTFTGSGGRVANGSILFSSPTHMLDRIHSISVDNEFFISNSFTCLLVQAGFEPDINRPNYFFDFLNHHRAGISETEKRIYINDKYYVNLHDCVNILVNCDLTIKRILKNIPSTPVDYSDYVSFLEQTAKRIIDNAMHPSRRKAFRPVTAISQGYDSTAVSVLASRAGCTEAVTFRKSGSAFGYVDDSGTVIADYLGLHTTEYERHDFFNIKGLPESEFYLNPFLMTDKAMVLMEEQLEGALLISGRHGENFWTTIRFEIEPYLKSTTALTMSGATLVEFRLRAGFIHLPLPYSGALSAQAIYDITMSREMVPWRIGGYYDRPIARRIVEEAGVPRKAFGLYKKGGNGRFIYLELSRASRNSFDEFHRDKVLGNKSGKLFNEVAMNIRALAAKWTHRLQRKALQRLNIAPIIPVHVLDRLHLLWGSKYLYVFHWGFTQIKSRYNTPLDKGLKSFEGSIGTNQRQTNPHSPR
jgi:hypothetical protein